MPIIELHSLQDPLPGLFYHLTDAQLRSRQEPDQAVLIAEGPKVVSTALACGLEPLSMLMRRKFIDGQGQDLIRQAGDIPVYTADDEILSALTGFRLQRSWVLCALRRPPQKTPAQVLKGARRIAVLENITEPSNLGALFRSAAALSMDALLLSPSCCDPYHRRAVRVCMGALFTLPFARISEDPFPLLRKEGFYSVGLALQSRSVSIDDPALLHERMALFLGTEDTGLSHKTLDSCDAIAKIPMAPGIDSLNVAAAGALAFWQFRVR